MTLTPPHHLDSQKSVAESHRPCFKRHRRALESVSTSAKAQQLLQYAQQKSPNKQFFVYTLPGVLSEDELELDAGTPVVIDANFNGDFYYQRKDGRYIQPYSFHFNQDEFDSILDYVYSNYTEYESEDIDNLFSDRLVTPIDIEASYTRGDSLEDLLKGDCAVTTHFYSANSKKLFNVRFRKNP